MTTPTIPAGQASRALKWNAAGSDLVNSDYDPDLLADSAAASACASANSAQASADSAAQAAAAALLATQKASSARSDAELCATLAAQVTADAAQVAADKVSAQAAAGQAVSARDAALSAQSAAESARDGAVSAKTAAESARDAAQSAQSAAETARDAAQSSASAAHASELNAAASATVAAASATVAAGSATAAQAAASSAASSASQAVTSAASAQTSATSAGNAASAAASSATDAAASAAAAAGSATTAQSAATSAASSASQASSSAGAASTSATGAANSATAAAASAASAQGYAQQVQSLSTQFTASQADIGLLYLGLARLTASTAPEQGGTEVADEFDDGSGVGSLGGATVASGYLTTGWVGLGANVATSGTASASTTANPASRANDGVTNSGYWNASSGNNTGWLQIDFGATSYVVGRYTIWSSDTWYNMPNAWTFEGWDGSSWVVLDTRSGYTSGWGSYTAFNFDIANTAAYAKYRVNISAGNGGGNVGMAELQLFPRTAPTNITAVSNAYTAQTTPTGVTLVAEYQDVAGNSVVGTDITFEVSRDNGTSWTAVTMTDFGPSPTGGRVLKGLADVSAQPSGTQVKWRIKTFNAKEQRVHGLWMQWK